MKRIVLASASPRRRELLEKAGLEFETDETDYAEDLCLPIPPHELAKELSRGKARAAARRHPDALVIAADTIIVLGGRVMGKPRDKGDAVRMLRALSGREHSAITAFTLIDASGGREHTEAVETKVRFRRLSEGEIAGYVESGEPMGKAGAYAIQGLGAALVGGIEGDLDNVVGLPVGALTDALRRFAA